MEIQKPILTDAFSATVLRQSELNPSRLTFALKRSGKVIFDLKISNGRLTGFGDDEVRKGNAVGAKPLSGVVRFDVFGKKLFIIRELLNNFHFMSVRCDVLDLETQVEKFANQKNFQEILETETDFIRIVPVPDSVGRRAKIYIIFRQQSVFLLHSGTAKETLLIKHEYNNVEDNLSQGFVTGQIPNVKLHYFEHATNQITMQTKYHTYNVYDMDEKFWGSVLGNDQVSLYEQDLEHIELATRASIMKKIIEELSEKEKFNKEVERIVEEESKSLQEKSDSHEPSQLLRVEGPKNDQTLKEMTEADPTLQR